MNYVEARPMIKTGDLLAFTHTELKSWYDFQVQVVRMATKSEFSHVGIAYVIYDRIFVLEAVSAGVRMFPLSRALPFYLVSNPILLKDSALEWAFARIGDRYENKIKMVLAELFDIDLKHNKRLQCSEYVNAILAANDQEITKIDTPTAIVKAAMEKWGALTYVNQ